MIPHPLQVFRSKILLVKPLLIENILHQYATCDDYIKDRGYNDAVATENEQDFAIAYEHVIIFSLIAICKNSSSNLILTTLHQLKITRVKSIAVHNHFRQLERLIRSIWRPQE